MHTKDDFSTRFPESRKMFLGVQEAAVRLGVTVGWLYARTGRKLIPHHKLGKFVRFTEEDLQKIEEATATGGIK